MPGGSRRRAIHVIPRAVSYTLTCPLANYKLSEMSMKLIWKEPGTNAQKPYHAKILKDIGKGRTLIFQYGKWDLEVLEELPIVDWLCAGASVRMALPLWGNKDERIRSLELLRGFFARAFGVLAKYPREIFLDESQLAIHIIPQFHVKLIASLDVNGVRRAMYGTSNWTAGALHGGNFELDTYLVRGTVDAVACASLSAVIQNQKLWTHRDDEVSTNLTKIFWRELDASRRRHAGEHRRFADEAQFLNMNAED